MITAHTNVIGSLLRPPELLHARDKIASGKLSQTEFKRIEDQAVDEAVRLQEDVGLEVVTDGEMRRLSFQGQMTEAVDGFGEHDINAFLWGDWYGDERVGDLNVPRPVSLGVVAKLRRKRHLSAEEFTYIRRRTTRIPKITLPSATLWANFWSKDKSASIYPTLESFLGDVVAILRDEVTELIRLGATYIQIDAPHISAMLNPHTRAFYEGQGWPLQRWLQEGIELDNSIIEGYRDVTFGLHLCRGNQGSRWLTEGSYDLLSRSVFRGTKAQRLLLEYDDYRSGSFEPLREVPEDKVVVLGPVTTKSPRRETCEELTLRIKEANRYFPLERLALSTQCGFSTSIVGNRISIDDERYKLKTIVETAMEVWRY